MRQELQRALLERAAKHHAAGTTDGAPAATRFKASIYADERYLRAERAGVLSRLPVLMAYSVQLRNAGDYVTHEWSGTPVLICRQEDGSVKAFLNSCRHRGAKLAEQKAGHADKVFTCRYHAWSYDTAGSLRSLPCPSQFPGLEKERCGLHELVALERAGMVFVVPNGGTDDEAGSSFSAYAEELEGFALTGFELYETKTVYGKINWKMMIEANQESYHIMFLHRDTAGPRFAAQLSLFDTLGPHTRTLLLHKQFSPRSLGDPVEDWRVLSHGDLVYFLFPNTLILLSTMSAHVLTAFPQGTDKTVVHGATLVPKGTRDVYPRQLYEKYWATILEDISVSESIQVAAQADASLELWLGGNECLLDHFHRALRERAPGQLR